ncbi:HAD family hydrolase [Clostridium hydrogenum]|uniref:HAD family hydrolase n=1 Tax=Clostridium hydrogenum TaxID=2855764 RepID=UPI002E38167B|nr:HAD-IA family hydrolase [Clostridium hydrogenum]
MIKAVIFDMDGVIIDSEPIHLKYAMELFKTIEIDMSIEEYNKFIGTNSYYMWNKIINDYKLKYTMEELIKMERNGFYDFISSPNMKIEPIKYIPELLKELKENNYKIAVASSSPMRLIEYILEELKIRKYFDNLVTGDLVERSKPEPDIFLYAAEKLGARPEECVVIEDSHNGVLAAKKAGMKCIGYRNLNSGNQDISKADIIIDSFEEINSKNI